MGRGGVGDGQVARFQECHGPWSGCSCPTPPVSSSSQTHLSRVWTVPTASAFGFRPARSYPASSFPHQLSFSAVLTMLTDPLYSSPTAAWITSHPSVVVVLWALARALTGTSASFSGYQSISCFCRFPFLCWSTRCFCFSGLYRGSLLFSDHTLSGGLIHCHRFSVLLNTHHPPDPQLHPLPLPGALLDGTPDVPEAPPAQPVQRDLSICPQACPCLSVP